MSKILKIGNKFYDFGTKNESFLITAQELKTLGIKNRYFMLEVRCPQLGVQDIDPFKEDITPEDIGRIHIESKANIWFWLREVARIPAGAPQPFPLCLTRASCAATWCYVHNINFILCQPRQTWKTTIVTLLSEYAFIYDLKNVKIPFMHLNEPKVLKNIGVLRDYIGTLPNYMNPFYGMTRPPGLKSLKYDAHGTSITPVTSADSEVKARDKLRGDTLFVGFLDEWEYITYVDAVISGAAPAMVSGREIAKKSNGRTCIMYASTPGNLDTSEGKAAQRMIDMTPNFSEQYYDLTDDDIKALFDGMVMEGSPDNGGGQKVSTLYIEFNYKQLRKSEDWLREQYEEAKRTDDIDEYRRGVLLQRFRGAGGGALFQQKDIDYIVQHTREPDHEIILLKKYIMYVYNHKCKITDINSATPYFDLTIPYLIGIDPATGSGGDNTAICIVHPYTMQVVAELMSPYLGVLDLMRVITQLATLIPKGVFCLESNSVGKTIIEFVQESQLENRFYHDPRLDMSKNAITKDITIKTTMKQKASERGYVGTWVSESLRREMFAILKRHMKDYRHLLNTKYLVKDITTLVVNKNGRIAADKKEHDDMVMAYLHTCIVLYYGHDLTRFGIDKDLCTFEKAYDIVNEYEAKLTENVVDNTVPYDTPTIYEEQALHDLMNSSRPQLRTSEDVDEYGLKKSQYDQYSGMDRTDGDVYTAADLAFFREVNSFY